MQFRRSGLKASRDHDLVDGEVIALHRGSESGEIALCVNCGMSENESRDVAERMDTSSFRVIAAANEKMGVNGAPL